jgi:hypothetical protein
MIRPILYVNLPAVVCALDRRARSRRGEFATFICAPDTPEPRNGLAALLEAMLLIDPGALTWICEDHWRLLGLAQARRRGRGDAWDLNYLAALSASSSHASAPPTCDVLLELLQYTLDAAVAHGIQRVFARVDDERPELELFGRAGFQRYARELSYWLPVSSDASGHSHTTRSAAAASDGAASDRDRLALRRWHRHDAWGLLRLYDATTPRRVQLAECLNSDEFAQTHAAVGHGWSLPLAEPRVHAYVHDRGVRLGGWLQLRHGRGAQPHRLWMMVHPEDAHLAGPLLRFGLRQLAGTQPRPVLCQVREYDGVVIDALRAAGFEHAGTRALLVRHLLMRALRHRPVPAIDSHVAYGVKGLGTAQSRLSEGGKTVYATHDH